VAKHQPVPPDRRATQPGQRVEVQVERQAALKGFAARIPPGGLAAVRADNRVRFLSQDRKLQVCAQQAATGVRRIGGSADGVHQTLIRKGTGVGVAVLDTGIDQGHPDLSPVQERHQLHHARAAGERR